MVRDKINILIVDSMHAHLMDSLKSEFNVDYKPGLSYDEVSQIIPDYQVLIVRTGIQVDAALIDKAQALILIARAGAGMDNIDEEAAKSRGIVCVNAPEGNRDAVAEHTIGMMLALLHNILKADKEVRNSLWQREENRGRELGALTVGIIGYGNTGSEVAKRLKVFGCRIMVYDKYKADFESEGIEACTMEDLFSHVDLLTLHIPLTDETNQMVNSIYINKFKKNIYLLNLSRGKIVNTRDVLKEMNSGKILGFATDVIENEQINHGLGALSTEQKKVFIDLIERENVIITPHIGGWSYESYEKISVVLANKVKDACKKRKELRNILVKH